jgi:hypothetical protein
MHYWGDEEVDWDGINNAADFIYDFCVKWARLGGQSKEKYGQVRFYASFGLSLHSLCYPGHYFYRFPKWLITADLFWITPACQKLGLSRLWMWYQSKIYRLAYKKAVEKWPHLRDEVLCAAGYPEFLVGI